jgi:hypothetical protein
MIVWGGDGSIPLLATGGRYNPVTDTWASTTTINVPQGRDEHTAVWTGNEMIIWGGQQELPFNYDTNGGRYNPSTDSWTATSTTNTPFPRGNHTAVWTGSEMIVWGGVPDYSNTGGRYNPDLDSWAATTTSGAPSGRAFHTAVWTGNEMIVWGGLYGPLNTGGRYCAQSGPTPTPTPTGTPTCTPGPLWYNGDFNGVNGLANEDNTSLGEGEFASVYDDFNVPSGGLTLTSVFSDNLSTTNIVGASWEIRQGISEGNGGTLIASGMTSAPVVTLIICDFSFCEYMVEVTGLNVSLAEGHYWLNVTPIGDLTGSSFDSTTSGANCVGTPCGNNQNAFFNSNFFGADFTSTSNEGLPFDFSMGVNGTTGCRTPTPTPTATPTATATVEPRSTPTPRPRPTPPPRP